MISNNILYADSLYKVHYYLLRAMFENMRKVCKI